MFGDAPLSDDAVAGALDSGWGMRAAPLEYRRIGYGSYHWLATDENGSRWIVTVDTRNGPFAVRRAYALAGSLAASGLDFVRAPRPANDGQVVLEMGEWLVSVWPWLEGRSTMSGEHASPADLAATLRCIRRLHDINDIDPVPQLVEDWVLPGRGELARLLVGEGWTSGPYAAEARELVVGSAARIGRGLTRYDALAEAVTAAGVDFVVTHGEPHAANVVHTADGPVLIDWDTVRWAPKERDLWSFVGLEGWRQGYGDGPVLSDAVEAYQLQWKLSEIADFGKLLAGARAANSDADVAMRELRSYLMS